MILPKIYLKQIMGNKQVKLFFFFIYKYSITAGNRYNYLKINLCCY